MSMLVARMRAEGSDGGAESAAAEGGSRPVRCRRRIAGGAALVMVTLIAGCETRDTVDRDLYIAELEAQVTQLETDLNAAYQEVSRLSQTLNAQVTSLEASMTDLNLRILDLPAAPDMPSAIREVEARMAVATQRVGDVRGTSNTLAQYLE